MLKCRIGIGDVTKGSDESSSQVFVPPVRAVGFKLWPGGLLQPMKLFISAC